MPLANIIVVGIFAGYVVGFVVLFAILRRLFADIAWYNAASISLVVTAGIVFTISYFIKRALYANAESLSAEHQFTVFGEDARDKPRNLRRRKR
jgi:Na+/H+ antiporter NhaA